MAFINKKMPINKDWTGNEKSVFKMIGATNHVLEEREKHDYYSTDPKAIDMLLEHESIEYNLWEPACGEGHLSKRLIEHGYNVYSSDLINRGYGEAEKDFLKEEKIFDGSIITNPPYRYATEFILKALELVSEGHYVYMFLKLTALEGQDRYKKIYSKYPPKKVYVFTKRISCSKNGIITGSSAVAYAWFVWEKGYQGETIIKWLL